MAVQSPILHAEWRTSMNVSLKLWVWPQGDAQSVAEFQDFDSNPVVQQHLSVQIAWLTSVFLPD